VIPLGGSDELFRVGSRLLDVVHATGHAGSPAGQERWNGPAFRRYEQAAANLEFVRIRIVEELGDIPSLIMSLGSAVETLGHTTQAWQDSIDEAESRVSAARSGDDSLAALAAEEALVEVRWAARRSLERQNDALEALDRCTASTIDAALRRLPTVSLPARLAEGAEPVVPGDVLAAELDSLAVDARRAMELQALGSLDRRIRQMEDVLEYFRRWGLGRVKLSLLDELRAHRDRLLEWALSERQFLRYDPRDGSRIVEVFGDLVSAEHIAVLVPGITNSEYNYHRHLEVAARALQGDDPDIAVIAWLGYDTPGSGPTGTGMLTLAAVGDDYAVEGAEQLARFVAWLSERRGDAHLSVIAHSYGSVVAAIAAAEKGLAIDELVLVGSPGVPVDHAADLTLDPDGNVWSGLAPWDPIDELARLAGRGGTLIHGTNPAGASFGAIDLPFEGVVGHSGYFDGAGIAVLASVVTGTRLRPENESRRARSGAW
jgi:pimeloyl-ACP methyl ester carboxylesterase